MSNRRHTGASPRAIALGCTFEAETFTFSASSPWQRRFGQMFDQALLVSAITPMKIES